MIVVAGPGPFKCPDCGVWWAGFEHRCQLDLMRVQTNTGTVRCTCHDRQDGSTTAKPWCPVHDVQTTYTALHVHDDTCGLFQ